MDVAEIEKVFGDAIAQAGDRIAWAVGVEPFGAVVLETMRPYLHDVAQAFVAACEAGDTEEQFAARMAALTGEES